jgi:hypothetical protein
MYTKFSRLRNTDITWGFVTKGDLLNLLQVFSSCSRRIHTYIHFRSLRCRMGTLRRRHIGIRECSGHGAEIFEEWRAAVLECRKMSYPEGVNKVEARLCSMSELLSRNKNRVSNGRRWLQRLDSTTCTVKTELQTWNDVFVASCSRQSLGMHGQCYGASSLARLSLSCQCIIASSGISHHPLNIP